MNTRNMNKNQPIALISTINGHLYVENSLLFEGIAAHT